MFGLIGNLGPWELVLVLSIVLIIFGPGKLPQLAESMGKAIKGFRKAQEEEPEQLEDKA
ncbi:MAG: twin-arginine translocase TatA/TatE family subunit [Syntrophomonadaceae bacterium]|jgi:sec-independent protein translocase protein TatA|nr:twin-arginine translocase TatA/TatE family subunit [Syntrophomonadaceae bacterium]